jgi:hypothetical protein
VEDVIEGWEVFEIHLVEDLVRGKEGRLVVVGLRTREVDGRLWKISWRQCLVRVSTTTCATESKAA